MRQAVLPLRASQGEPPCRQVPQHLPPQGVHTHTLLFTLTLTFTLTITLTTLTHTHCMHTQDPNDKATPGGCVGKAHPSLGPHPSCVPGVLWVPSETPMGALSPTWGLLKWFGGHRPAPPPQPPVPGPPH